MTMYQPSFAFCGKLLKLRKPLKFLSVSITIANRSFQKKTNSETSGAKLNNDQE